jgi:hypothetical protein
MRLTRSHIVWNARVVGLSLLSVAWLSVNPASSLAAGDANRASCGEFPGTEASPGFSSYLPDCRAYELVSPTYKAGTEIAGLAAASEDGAHLVVQTLGAFAGSTDTGNLTSPNNYELSRTVSGWAASPLDPLTSQFAAAYYQDSSRALDSSLWDAHTPSQSIFTNDLYLRGPHGSFTFIGHMLPPSATIGPTGPRVETDVKVTIGYLGGSSDLTHVVFNINAATTRERGISDLWPGDTTKIPAQGHPAGEGNSLYEYVGFGTDSLTPLLVGVEGARGSTSLISSCGTVLGSEEKSASRGGNTAGSTYNAISDSGAKVFFTAVACEGAPPVDELFARLAESQTVAISQPAKANCEACDVSKPKNAVFQGASEDGSKAFFLSEEKLLPGAEGTSLYRYDFNGAAGKKVTLLAPEAQGVARISEDGSHVYFVAGSVLTSAANGQGQRATLGASNLYVYEQDPSFPSGHIAFVTALNELDEEVWGQNDTRPVQATPDGRFLVFVSHRRLTPGDESSEGVAQLFEYDAQTGELARVSVGQKSTLFPNGYNKNGNIESEAGAPFIKSPNYAGSSSRVRASVALTVSSDGSRVVFRSADALTPLAVSSARPGCNNVYEYHSSGSIRNGNVDLISDGQDISTINELCGPSGQLIDPSGNDVFFLTGSALAPQDTNTQADLYDARAGGGFPAPASSPGCSGDACLGPLGAPPALPVADSFTQSGAGNLTAPAASTSKSESLTRSQNLAKALRSCRSRPRMDRHSCEARARRRYSLKPKAGKSNREGHR